MSAANKSNNANCPSCGQPVTLVGIQEYPAKYNLPSRKLVHCTNPTCPMNFHTTTDLNRTWTELQESLQADTEKGTESVKDSAA